MNILGMGPMELLLIVVLALIVFGPAKLPEIMAQVGKAIADFRRATSELSDEFNRTIQSELQETRAVVDETKATFTDAKASVYDAHASVSSAITGTPAPVRTAVPGEALPAPNGTSTPPHGESAANGTAPAQSTPALADTTQWSWETSASPPSPATPASEGSAAKDAPAASSAEAAPGTPNPAPPPPSPPKERTAGDELAPPY
jgi:sec-independent protein translocase protein TatB